MKGLLLFTSAMCLMFCCGTACGKKELLDTDPVADLDLERYLGTWYEIARFDHSFEKDMEYCKAVYTLQEDGKVLVENSGIKNGEFKSSMGKAYQVDPVNQPAHLRVSFFWPFYSDYRVLWVDPEYQYALVSSKGPDYLWILAREKQVPKEVKDAILEEASFRGFDTQRLTWVVQDEDAFYNM